MRLMTIFELTTRSESELRAIFRETANALTRTVPGSPERRNALATLENVAAVMRIRNQRQP